MQWQDHSWCKLIFWGGSKWIKKEIFLQLTLSETLVFPADFPTENNPQEFLGILSRYLLLRPSFPQILSPHEYPAGNVYICCGFPVVFRMSFPSNFAAVLFYDLLYGSFTLLFFLILSFFVSILRIISPHINELLKHILKWQYWIWIFHNSSCWVVWCLWVIDQTVLLHA